MSTYCAYHISSTWKFWSYLLSALKFLDVVLPFTNQEAVVYCNDDEFESLLDKKHSVKVLADLFKCFLNVVWLVLHICYTIIYHFIVLNVGFTDVYIFTGKTHWFTTGDYPGFDTFTRFTQVGHHYSSVHKSGLEFFSQ